MRLRNCLPTCRIPSASISSTGSPHGANCARRSPKAYGKQTQDLPNHSRRKLSFENFASDMRREKSEWHVAWTPLSKTDIFEIGRYVSDTASSEVAEVLLTSIHA